MGTSDHLSFYASSTFTLTSTNTFTIPASGYVLRLAIYSDSIGGGGINIQYRTSGAWQTLREASSVSLIN